jgi:hypothetical protein
MKLRKTLKSVAICAAALTMVCSSGCALLCLGIGAGAGIAGTAYYEGKLKGTIKATPIQVKTATEAAFKELKIKQVSSKADALSAAITGTTAAGKTATVTASLKKDGQSEIGVRVGSFGDRDISEKIYSAIQKRLDKK